MNALTTVMNPRKVNIRISDVNVHSFVQAFDLTPTVKAVDRHLNRFIVIFFFACMALYEAFYRGSETGRVLAFLYLILVAFRSWFLLVKSSDDLEKKVNRCL